MTINSKPLRKSDYSKVFTNYTIFGRKILCINTNDNNNFNVYY